jgi:phytoene/squalene synthetase
MRQDLSVVEHDQASFEKYVYGSAEVVGLMCLKVFVSGRKYSSEQSGNFGFWSSRAGCCLSRGELSARPRGRLQSAGSVVFSGVNAANFDEATKARLVGHIDEDLERARRSLALLPRKPRSAVVAALGLFAALNRKIAKTPAHQLIETRIRVNDAAKLLIVLRAIFAPTSL